jgi:hypothetical protein
MALNTELGRDLYVGFFNLGFSSSPLLVTLLSSFISSINS